MFQSKVVEKSRHVFHVQHLFPKIAPLQDNAVKYCTAGQAIDENTTLAHCMMDT